MSSARRHMESASNTHTSWRDNRMSASRIVGALLRLALAIFLILYGIATRRHGVADESFGEYQNLEHCIAKNWGKRRDPEQYCKATRSRVRSARRRKYGR